MKSDRPYNQLVRLFRFSKLTPAVLAEMPPDSLSRWQGWAIGFPKRPYVDTGGGWDAPPIKSLGELAAQVSAGLRQCAQRDSRGAASGVWKVPIAGTLYVHEGRASYVGQGLENTFLAEAAKVLAATTRSIRLCARDDCQRVFVARRRGKFCHPKCSWVVRSRRDYDKTEIRRLKRGGKTAAEARQIVEDMRRQRRNERLAREAGIGTEIMTDYDMRNEDKWTVWHHISFAAAIAIQNRGQLT